MLTATLLTLLTSGGPGSKLHLTDSDAPVRFAQAEPDDGSFTSLDGMTRGQLQREWQLLDEGKPGLAMPIVLMSVGGAVGLYGVVLLAGGITSSGFSTLLLVAAFGAAALMIVIGAVVLYLRLGERAKVDTRMEEVRARINQFNGVQPQYEGPPQPQQQPELEQQPPGGPVQVPPPPPPPPSSVEQLRLTAPQQVVLASF